MLFLYASVYDVMYRLVYIICYGIIYLRCVTKECHSERVQRAWERGD